VRPAPTRPAPDAARLELAAMLIGRAALPGDVDLDQAVAALARVLAAHPPGSPHGGLLGAALRPRSPAEKQAGPRPPAEVAVRALLRCGQTPTPRAVAAEAERRHARAVSRAARREQIAERLRPLVDQATPAIAELTALHQERTELPPTCRWLAPRLAARFAVPLKDGWRLIHLIHEETTS
jgi:hypothetical protein